MPTQNDTYEERIKKAREHLRQSHSEILSALKLTELNTNNLQRQKELLLIAVDLLDLEFRL